MNVERRKIKGKRKRPSSWLRRSKFSSASIWSHLSVQRLCTPVSSLSWESKFPRDLGLALPLKHLYTLQIRETFAKEGVWGPINLFEWKRVGLVIMYLHDDRPFLCSPPWFRDSRARFWYFVADHVDEIVVRPAQRAAVRKNVDFFLRSMSVPLFFLPGEIDEVVEKEELGAATVSCAAGLQRLGLCDTSD